MKTPVRIETNGYPNYFAGNARELKTELAKHGKFTGANGCLFGPQGVRVMLCDCATRKETQAFVRFTNSL